MKAKKDEMMQKYGRLDWGPVKNDNKRNAEEGKRYEGLPILMNLQSGGILTCDVIEVSEKGFLVKPLSISGFRLGGGGGGLVPNCSRGQSDPRARWMVGA